MYDFMFTDYRGDELYQFDAERRRRARERGTIFDADELAAILALWAGAGQGEPVHSIDRLRLPLTGGGHVEITPNRMARINETPSILQLRAKQRTLGGLLGDRWQSEQRHQSDSVSATRAAAARQVGQLYVRKTSAPGFSHTMPFRQGLACRFWRQNRLKRRVSHPCRKSCVFRHAASRPKWMVETPKAQARLEKLFLPFPVRPVTVRFKAFRLFWPRWEIAI
jgi:hypothetical protein